MIYFLKTSIVRPIKNVPFLLAQKCKGLPLRMGLRVGPVDKTTLGCPKSHFSLFFRKPKIAVVNPSARVSASAVTLS